MGRQFCRPFLIPVILTRMALDLVVEKIKSGAFEHALLLLQENLSKKIEPSSQDFLMRSKILRKLGARSAADADLKRALVVDPLDPQAQLEACRFEVEDRHGLAARLLCNPAADRKSRQLALAFLDANALPLATLSDLGVSARLTVVHDSEQDVAIQGLREEDRKSELGRIHLQGGKFVVVDYILKGQGRGREIGVTCDGEDILQAAHQPELRDGTTQPAPRRLQHPRDLWIVIPVHNGDSVVERCVHSALRAIRQLPSAKILVVDDASTDRQTLSYLASLRKRRDLEVIRNETNLGFVGAVNQGLKRAGPGPVLLLNSDTYLPVQVLPRLLAHLEQSDVGTVTPFSNNGGSFSIPHAKREYALPSNEQCDAIAETAFQQNSEVAVDILHGNGFAMLISGACRQATGVLSAEFESGYYEEVDYCLRARAAGFRNVCATDCFIGHQGSESYGEKKQELAALNLRRLAGKYPAYRKDFERMAVLDPLREYRRNIVSALDFELEKNPKAPSAPPSSDVALTQSDGLLAPVMGPFSSAFLNRCFDSLFTLSDRALRAHGLSITLPHDFRFAYVCGDEEGTRALAFLKGEKVQGLFDLRGASMPTETEYGLFEKTCLLKMKETVGAI